MCVGRDICVLICVSYTTCAQTSSDIVRQRKYMRVYLCIVCMPSLYPYPPYTPLHTCPSREVVKSYIYPIHTYTLNTHIHIYRYIGYKQVFWGQDMCVWGSEADMAETESQTLADLTLGEVSLADMEAPNLPFVIRRVLLEVPEKKFSKVRLIRPDELPEPDALTRCWEALSEKFRARRGWQEVKCYGGAKNSLRPGEGEAKGHLSMGHLSH